MPLQCHLQPVSRCLYGISLLGLGLTRILPFKVWGVPRPGAGVYGEVRPEAEVATSALVPLKLPNSGP
jgi:hypothetical protein